MNVIFIAFILLLVVVLFVVMLSYSMCWYEYANADPRLMEDRFKAKKIWLAASLILQEVFFNLLTLLTLPFGIWAPRQLPQHQGETPVLLLHGLFINRASWLWFKWSLRRRGFRNLVTINLSSYHNEEALTEQVAKLVDNLRHRLNVDKVHLVGHSMGGIIARNFVQLRGGGQKVDRCICLGAPHSGSKLTPFTVTPLSKVLIPNSEFLNRLKGAELPAETRIINIYSLKDNMVVPATFAHLDKVENIVLDRVGHTGMLYRRKSIAAVAAALESNNENS